MNPHAITCLITLGVSACFYMLMHGSSSGGSRTHHTNSDSILGHFTGHTASIKLRVYGDPLPDKIHDFTSSDELVDFVNNNGELIGVMYHQMKVDRLSCVAMHHFLTPDQKTYNFMIVNKHDQREFDKLNWWSKHFIYSRPLANDQWSIALFNAEIKGKSDKMYEVSETSTLCRHKNPTIKTRHGIVFTKYWTMRGNNTEDDVYSMETEFHMQQSFCIQKTVEEIKTRVYCH